MTLIKPQDHAITVLLVDDQPMMGEAVRRALQNEADLVYHYCPKALDALRVAATVKPTVILQDLVMPEMDGLSLVKQYRSSIQTTNVPIIVLSTKEEAATKHDAFLAGANDYLVKLPATLELVARIRYHSRAYLNLIQRDEAYQALRDSEQKLIAANLELQSISNSDGLTGLSNRRHFDEYLNAEWRRAMREQSCLSVLMVDVDNFKSFNDHYGHLEGDQVLRSIGETLRKVCQRPADLVARFGGEEFSVVLPATDPAGARDVGERMRAAVEGLAVPHVGATTGPVVTVSIGMASVTPTAETSPTGLLKRADEGLYKAKRNGRNRVAAFDD